jgi:hypothetical protein
MGYEIRYLYHPRKEAGGYDTDTKEEKTVKVGKPFDDTPLEKCAAAIMLQLARRDVWVVDVKVYELVKTEINFKEAADGRGIILKNKKYNLGSTAEALAEDLVEEAVIPPMMGPSGLQPHEIVALQRQHQHQESVDLSNLYDGNTSVPIKKTPRPPVNQNKIMYYVIFEPLQWINEARKNKLKFTLDKKYPVHAVIPKKTITGEIKLDAQEIAVTDDTGKVVILDEKYFTAAGRGLFADEQLGFSGSNGRDSDRPRLMHEDELTIGPHPEEMRAAAQQRVQQQPYKQVRRPSQMDIPVDIPIDDGSIPEELFAVPDIRPGRKIQ